VPRARRRRSGLNYCIRQRRRVACLWFVVPGIRTDGGERTRAPTTHLVAVVHQLSQFPSASWRFILFSDHLLEHLLIQREVGHQPLQSRVLFASFPSSRASMMAYLRFAAGALGGGDDDPDRPQRIQLARVDCLGIGRVRYQQIRPRRQDTYPAVYRPTEHIEVRSSALDLRLTSNFELLTSVSQSGLTRAPVMVPVPPPIWLLSSKGFSGVTAYAAAVYVPEYVLPARSTVTTA
jgi:hypothetical protein